MYANSKKPHQDPFILHKNQTNKTLQLQIDIFCIDIYESVRSWDIDEVENNNTLICLYDVYGNKVIR
jgi:hypothetical protein